MVGNINLMDCKLTDFSSDALKHKVTLHKRCNDCIFLPKCFGGCHYNFLNGELPCNNNVFLIKGYLLSLMS
jgi:radical SAM protein with 4Fe4S-binding SPASM domain